MRLLLVFSIFAPSIFAQLMFDESLQKACEYKNGTWRQRESSSSIQGDRCEMTFTVAVHDQDDANEFCELYAPWRLTEAVIGKNGAGSPAVTCQVEATLTCKSGWTQMFGHCFRMPDKHNTFTHDEAVNFCKSQEGGSVDAKMGTVPNTFLTLMKV